MKVPSGDAPESGTAGLPAEPGPDVPGARVPGSNTLGPTTPEAREGDGESSTGDPLPDSPWAPKVRTARERQKPPDTQRAAMIRALMAFSLDEFPQCFPTM